ncbi:integrase core domain-containing protein [Stenotrophomonas geniculata]
MAPLREQGACLARIADWIAIYNQQRPHQALKMMTRMRLMPLH